jgi:hypothetical protein
MILLILNGSKLNLLINRNYNTVRIPYFVRLVLLATILFFGWKNPTGDIEKKQLKDKLESGFLNPPAQARPHIWWHWMNGNITKEGITADLEAMHRVGFGGVYIFNIAGPRMNTDIPSGPIDYLSKEWLDLVKYSVQEAERLGMEVGIHNCAGWATTGGPWIKPEHSMQMLVFSEEFIPGNQSVKKILPHPETRENYYRDIAVYAIPTVLNTEYRVHQWPQKSGQAGSRNNRQPLSLSADS